MESYNSILRYFFPILFFLQYVGCDAYRDLGRMSNQDASVETIAKDDCSALNAYNYNGFYKPETDGKLFKKKEGEYFTDSLLVSKVPVIDFSKFKSVSKGYSPSGNPTIEVILTENGTQLFKEHTSSNIGKKLAIIIKDELIVAPIINSEIPEGRIQISGNFTSTEANKIYIYLNRMIQCAKRN